LDKRILRRWQAYERAVELDPSRLYSTLRAGSLQLALGATGDAEALFEAALRLSPDHPAALLGMAHTLLAAARSFASLHATGASLAAVRVSRCIRCAGLFSADYGIPHWMHTNLAQLQAPVHEKELRF
jgi:tetratricopeptide (TPR) repeat protein